MRRGWRYLAFAVALGCTQNGVDRTVDPGEGAPRGLAASLDARVQGDSVVLTLHLSNPTSEAVRLEFPTAQRYDFEVGRLNGERVWQSSADRMYAQVLGVETLGAGETVEYREAWAGGAPGEYYVRGRVVSSNRPVELRTGFEIPAH